MAFGRKDGSGRGLGQPGGLRGNINRAPCPTGGPGYSRGGGRGLRRRRDR